MVVAEKEMPYERAAIENTPPAFKQTEVGMIPSDWEVKKLKDITDLITCGIAATPIYVDRSIGIPFLSSTNVKNGQIQWLDFKYIGADLHSKLYKNNPPKKGDVLYSRVGTIGEAAIVEVDYEFSIYVSLTLIKPKLCLYNEYLTHLLNSTKYKELANREVFLGGGVGNLNVSVVRDFSIPLPTLAEQRAIATALSDVDALITKLNALITKKRNIKQGTMQQLLTGKKRLPEFSGEWLKIDLKNSSTLKARIGWQGLTTDEYLKNGDYYLVTGTDFNGNEIAWKSCHYVDMNRFVQDRNIQLKINDVLVTKDGTIGKVAYVDYLPGEATLNSGIFVIRPRTDAYLPIFLFCILKSEMFTAFLNQLAAGSTISHLYQKDFVNFSFFAPPTLAEQGAIAQILSDMDADLDTLTQKRDKYKAVKQGMMQQLLTGKIRLPVAT